MTLLRFNRAWSLPWVAKLVLVLSALVVIQSNANAAVAYIRSTVGAPWGVNTNEQAMDMVFGAGGWDDLRYETVDPGILYSAAYTLIYMEGSEFTASELEAFMTANQAALEAWVNAGGRLFLNAAPSEGTFQSWGFGNVFMNPSPPGLMGSAVHSSHPIWNGPFLPTSPDSFSGGAEPYALASVVGNGLISHISDSGHASLAELPFGMGRVMFGGLTTSNFWDPAPEALNLRANILAYLLSNNVVCFNGNHNITDDNPAGINNMLVGNAGILQDLNVSVAINHTYVGDLIVSLTSPAGTPVVLIDRPGVPMSMFGCSQNNIDATLDDGASSSAEMACVIAPPASAALGGRLTPNGFLSDFVGENFAGNWTLNVSDHETADSGPLVQWCLIPTFAPPPPDDIFRDGFED